MVARLPLARRAWASLLLVFASALLLAQTQGLMHRVVHLEHHESASPHEHTSHHGDGEETDWVLRLFAAHDDGDTVCRLFDQSGHSASTPAVPLPGLPLLASPRHVSCHEALPPAPVGTLPAVTITGNALGSSERIAPAVA